MKHSSGRSRVALLTVLGMVSALLPLTALPAGAQAGPSVFINEIHYDNAGTDEGEAIEVAGPSGTDLAGWTIVLYNGSNGLLYETTALSGVIADQMGGYGTVVVSYPSNGIQNGAPDGMALVDASSTVVQFLSYEGAMTAGDGPASGVTSTDIGVSETSATPIGNSLFLVGTGTTYGDFTWSSGVHSFGEINAGQTFSGVTGEAVLVINEVDYDQPSTDTAEFVEIANVGTASAELSDYTLKLINGTGGGAAEYQSFTLPAGSLAAGDYFVICGDAANVANCDLDVSPDSNLIQNGAPDAVALVTGGVLGDTIVDTVSYEGDTGVPYTEGSGVGLEDDSSVIDLGISRTPDGTDTNQNNLDLSPRCITPGDVNSSASTDCEPPATADLLINEVDADQVSTDSAEFVELYDGGSGATDLTGLVLVFFNGSNDLSYASFDLDGMTTTADGYFVLCGDAANVANCDLDVSPDTNLIQNGADAVALYSGDATSFPTNTAVTTDGLLDAIVYDTDDADDPGLLVLLNAGQPQVNEGAGAGGATGDSSQRCPNGSGGPRNTDTYAQWAPTAGESNPCEIVVPPLSCDDPLTVTLISEVQGNGTSSPLAGSEVVVDAVVTGIFPGLSGFYVQEEPGDQDADQLTSEGVFVFGGDATGLTVNDVVRVRGDVSEFSTSGGASIMTEINASGVAACAADPVEISPTDVSFPVTAVSDLERYEGMLVTFPQSLVISEYFNFDRFGEVVVTSERHLTPTAEFEPGPDAILAATDFLLDRITIDDGRSSQNPDPAIHPGNGNVFDLTNLFRGGDTITDITGVIDDTFGLYRMQPTHYGTYASINPRTAAPDDVGGNLEVASFNVLNYFTTLDGSGNICGPAADQGCRGADDANELTRQRDKILAALSVMDSDVVGLIEIENYPGDVPTADLVAGLNALVAGTYDYIATGAIGTDAIRVALIYKPAAVSPVGAYAVLDSSVDPRFIDTKSRPVLAQTFIDNETGGVFTVAVNHLKSKGSACDDVGDPDLGDGAGNCNVTRTLAAEALVDWLATDPTGSGDEDFLIIGDLNSYDKEDPIDAILDGSDDVAGSGDDYTDLIRVLLGEDAYSYVFDGQIGYLDHALANLALLDEVTGVTVWHINADEPDAIDYDTSFKQDAQDAIYAPDPYRSSDHDPVIVGLDACDEIAPTIDVSVSTDLLWPPNHKYRTVGATVVAEDNFDSDPTVTLLSVVSNEPDNGSGDGNTINDIVIVDDFTFKLRAERSGNGTGRIYTITYQVTDDCGNGTIGTAEVYVPLNNS